MHSSRRLQANWAYPHFHDYNELNYIDHNFTNKESFMLQSGYFFIQALNKKNNDIFVYYIRVLRLFTI